TSTADSTFQLNEASEANNADTKTIECTSAPPALKPNYVPTIAIPSTLFVGVPFTAQFTTKNIGNAAAAVPSITHTTFQATAKDFTIAPLAVNAQQVDGWIFTCSSPGAKSMVETVDNGNAIDELLETDNTQALPVMCNAKPTSCSLAFAGSQPPFGTFSSSAVVATCFAGSAQTPCPPFLWQQSATGGSMSPANTPSGAAPSSTLSLSNAPTPQIGEKVNATSTLTSIPLYCELPFDISNTPIGPDYVVTSILPDHPTVALNQVVQFTVTVFNQGNMDAVNDSISTAAFSPGCTVVSGRDSYPLPPINAQASGISVNRLACTCVAAGTQSITVTANPTQAQWETDFANNDRVQSFICQAPFQTITCSYFV
ncbi:MAG: CARDB domain-containing protein, partial [Candidatus Micrarchaeia archaeon]